MTLSSVLHCVVAATIFMLVGCGGGDSDTGGSSSDTGGVITPAVFTVTNLALPVYEWLPATGSFAQAVSGGSGEVSLVSIREQGIELTAQQQQYPLTNGTLTIDGLDFHFTANSTQGTKLTFTLASGTEQASATLTISATQTDPLAYQQWHLYNTGQLAYAQSDSARTFLINYYTSYGLSRSRATSIVDALFNEYSQQIIAGEDINILPAYAQNITGAGVISVVVDSGLQLNHEDLAANILSGRSVNLNSSVSDASDPSPTGTAGDHGTSVAGIIAAAGWNGIGGRGVAPDSQLIGFNLLASSSTSTVANELLSHGLNSRQLLTTDNIGAINRSYSATMPVMQGYPLTEETAHAYSATRLRSGLGAINVKAVGNYFADGDGTDDDPMEGDLCAQNGANTYGLTCYNTNMEFTHQSPYYLQVAALSTNGRHSNYSSAGASLWLSAPAGDRGDIAPAIITTDVMGCDAGYSSTVTAQEFDNAWGQSGAFAALFAFNASDHPENTDCNYMSYFSGTSAAAPMVSGVVALMLQANPQLTYRDVQHILAQTSVQVDTANSPVYLTLPDGQFEAHSGWVTNAAGFTFNNLYGFGRVDAGAAVQAALTHTLLAAEKQTDWTGTGLHGSSNSAATLQIPDNSVQGATVTLNVSDNISIETVQLKLTVYNSAMLTSSSQGTTQSTAAMDLAIEVFSPAGTRSVLLSSKQALLLPAMNTSYVPQRGYPLYHSVFRSNAFYGETAAGEWTIRVLDAGSGNYVLTENQYGFSALANNTVNSVLQGAAIRIFGH